MRVAFASLSVILSFNLLPKYSCCLLWATAGDLSVVTLSSVLSVRENKAVLNI